MPKGKHRWRDFLSQWTENLGLFTTEQVRHCIKHIISAWNWQIVDRYWHKYYQKISHAAMGQVFSDRMVIFHTTIDLPVVEYCFGSFFLSKCNKHFTNNHCTWLGAEAELEQQKWCTDPGLPEGDCPTSCINSCLNFNSNLHIDLIFCTSGARLSGAQFAENRLFVHKWVNSSFSRMYLEFLPYQHSKTYHGTQWR